VATPIARLTPAILESTFCVLQLYDARIAKYRPLSVNRRWK
jgi:hypothetical protein